jgi:small subunit ribosomal protein S4
MNYVGPKVKLSRQLGIPLTPKAARIMERKPYAPGQHGRYQQFKRKESDFKRQLVEKQRLRSQYNIHERQLRNYYKKATGMGGNAVDNLVQLLETRLDSVVARSGLARTIYAARQYVSHGHIEVNGKQVDIPSYTVSIDDVVSVREKSQKIPCFTDALETTSAPPEYLDRSAPNMSTRLTSLPIRDDVPIVGELSLVIEFYSR